MLQEERRKEEEEKKKKKKRKGLGGLSPEKKKLLKVRDILDPWNLLSFRGVSLRSRGAHYSVYVFWFPHVSFSMRTKKKKKRRKKKEKKKAK